MYPGRGYSLRVTEWIKRSGKLAGMEQPQPGMHSPPPSLAGGARLGAGTVLFILPPKPQLRGCARAPRHATGWAPPLEPVAAPRGKGVLSAADALGSRAAWRGPRSGTSALCLRLCVSGAGGCAGRRASTWGLSSEDTAAGGCSVGALVRRLECRLRCAQQGH